MPLSLTAEEQAVCWISATGGDPQRTLTISGSFFLFMAIKSFIAALHRRAEEASDEP